MLATLYPDAVTSVVRYPIGHVATHSGGVLQRCWVCSGEFASLIKVALGDWRCGVCVPEDMKPPGQRSTHNYGNRVAQAVRHCAPALELFLAVSQEDGLQEVPRGVLAGRV